MLRWLKSRVLLTTRARVAMGVARMLARSNVSAEEFGLYTQALDMASRRSPVGPQPVEPPSSTSRVVVIAPHPDDETIAAGGTLLRAVQNGASCTVIYASDGAYGPTDALARSMARTRRQEAETVARMGGWKAVFLGLRLDGSDRADSLVRTLIETRPTVLLLPHFSDGHTEHRRLNLLLDAGRKHLHDLRCDVWSYSVWTDIVATVAVDVTSIHREKDLLNDAYASQHAAIDITHLARSTAASNYRQMLTRTATSWELFFRCSLSEYLELLQDARGLLQRLA